MSVPRSDLLDAYRNTDYVIMPDDGDIVVHIDAAAPALMALLDSQSCTTAALLTAFNPRSEPAGAAENRAAHARLLARLDGYRLLPTVHRDPAGIWPDEEGVLVAGIDQDTAIQVARDFAQNALVWIAAGELPVLIWAAD